MLTVTFNVPRSVTTPNKPFSAFSLTVLAAFFTALIVLSAVISSAAYTTILGDLLLSLLKSSGAR